MKLILLSLLIISVHGRSFQNLDLESLDAGVETTTSAVEPDPTVNPTPSGCKFYNDNNK